MSKIKNDGLVQYGAGPFEQQQFGTAGVEGVNVQHSPTLTQLVTAERQVVKIREDQPEKGIDGYGRKAITQHYTVSSSI